MNATQDRTASTVAAEAVDSYVSICAPADFRTAARQDMAALIVQVLDVVDALTVTSDLDRAYAYTRRDNVGALAGLPALERVEAMMQIAREAANFVMPTNYASTGGTRQAEANDLANAVVTALFQAGMLTVTPVEIVKAILDRNYRRDTGTLAERVVAALGTEDDGYTNAFREVRNAIWMTYSGGGTATKNAADIFAFLGRGNEIERD